MCVVVFLVELWCFLSYWVVLCCLLFFFGGGEGIQVFLGIGKVKVCCCWKDTRKGKILCSLSKRGDHRWISQILRQSIKKRVNRSVAWVFFRYIPTWLVVSTHLKNIGQNGNLPQTGVKILKNWNHHLPVATEICSWLITSYLHTAKSWVLYINFTSTIVPLVAQLLPQLRAPKWLSDIRNCLKKNAPSMRRLYMWVWCVHICEQKRLLYIYLSCATLFQRNQAVLRVGVSRTLVPNQKT